MANEINFLDLLVLKRIKPDTTVEKFGSLINSSFFDASNTLGTLKLKGLVDFTTYVPGQNSISITEMGKKLIEEASAKEKEPFDQLDLEIITQLSKGKRNLADLGTAVNINPKDLAMHIDKLNQQQYLSADIRNGTIDISLTEKGFMQSKSGMPQQGTPPQSVAATQQTAAQPNSTNQANPATGTAQVQKPIQMAHPTTQHAPAQTAKPPTPAPTQTAAAEQISQQGTPPEMPHPQEDKELAEMQKQLSQNVKPGSKKMLYVGIVVIIIIILLVLFAEGTI